MQNVMEVAQATVAGEELELHPCGAIYWPAQRAVLLADVHLGKARHFQRAGIPVPTGVNDTNIEKLIYLLVEYQPERLLLLGDLFHSDFNAAWDEFAGLVKQFDHVRFELILGNHDRYADTRYTRAGMELYPTHLDLGPFHLTHEPAEDIPAGLFNLAGHIHPCVHLHGGGKQRMRLPCFFFGQAQGIVPAFGTFTGMHPIPVTAKDQVFVIAEDSVVRVR